MYYLDYETLKETTISKLWDAVNNASDSDWHRDRADVEWRICIPKSIFAEDPKTSALIEKFVNPNRVFIQRLEAKTSYAWHIDYPRKASLSVCLNCFDNSYTLFGEKSNKSLGPNHIPNLDPLFYTPRSMYLFSGNKWHTGINLSDETRYLISITLTEPTSINDAIEFLKTQFPE